ncbi:Protein MHF1-like protein [Vigna angularis]|uniref:Protein MHF1-like protein n=1 Tax=Phaseolus angularis TaxID=3914 RepID=A0A8T0KN34_PHAAN|nr:Protein MHF1-like protein [Vigna angularis]
MESADTNSEVENDAEMKLLRDKFRLSAIAITESQAKHNGMTVSKVVVTCIADLAFKYTEGVAKDLRLFAQHANRKSVNMEDVILCAHRNEHLSGLLRTYMQTCRGGEDSIEAARRRGLYKGEKNQMIKFFNWFVLGTLTAVTVLEVSVKETGGVSPDQIVMVLVAAWRKRQMELPSDAVGLAQEAINGGTRELLSHA